jgi:chitosanase
MYLTPIQRRLIERSINTIETGTPEGDYGAISIYADGPHKMRQITYGRAQTTEYGNLRKLVQMYAAVGGTFSQTLNSFANIVGSVPLTDNDQFKNLLRNAGRKDPVMKQIQDQFFDQVYFLPAMHWADENGFTKALSCLVIYDSYIHSGQILWTIRQKFAESPPGMGGNEEVWIKEYVDARHDWLENHQNPIVRKSIYRTAAFKEQIATGNWDLLNVPITINGTNVY